MELFEVAALVGLFVILAAVGLAWVFSSRKREARDEAVLQQSIAAAAHIPQTLHPVIDGDICIGSLSCLAVCPEGDILGVVDGKAALINASACIGHGKCALECPVGAIKLVFGTAERGLELPEVNEYFETSRPGVHIVGELGGMGLIKNAITQGLQVADHLAGSLEQRLGEKPLLKPGVVDVAVVGAGPAGLATALGLKEKGRSFRVLEQDTVGGTIAHYPRQKVVMSERIDLPFYGPFGNTYISKEELIASWSKAIQKGGLKVEEGVKVQGIEGQDGLFAVKTSKGDVLARKVVLAVGRRGSPRKLGCPGEELEKVSYRLIDPEQYDGAKVLVVGGGDSALEAAVAVAAESDAEVTLSYRNGQLGKCREANKRRFTELVAKGTIKAMMPSQVRAVRKHDVVLESEGTQIAVRNDYVVVCIGGEAPTEFLNQAGVKLKLYRGKAIGETSNTGLSTGAIKKKPKVDSKRAAELRAQSRLAWGLGVLGVVILVGLWLVGKDYYTLERADRLAHPAHAVLKSAGNWGHGVGIVATGFMMSNFLYAVRKRWRRLKGLGPIRNWLTFHQFVGFMSPLVIAFHATFQSNNVLATATAASLAVVVATGVVGRFVFGLIPTADGRTLEYTEVVARWERLRRRVDSLMEGVTDPTSVRSVLARATDPATAGPLIPLLWRIPMDDRRSARLLRGARALFPSRDGFEAFADAFWRLNTLRWQVTFYRSLKRFMAIWRVLHVVLAGGLVVMITAHIGVSLFLGYKWIFS
ncbi:MAG: NAD(P)-binding domain-containing protein [Myxococcaceae bacterium]|nr:NAD(P)-binding domain-containing protein [Myxococcaceae bacterium]